MTVRTRADLDVLPTYVPGRTVPGAIKLASNEVSPGPLPSVREAVAAAATGINRYPDSGATELTARLAAELDVPPEHLAIGCGSVTLCQQLVQAMCSAGDEVVFAWRSFEMYPIIARVAGVTARQVPLTATHEHDLSAMAAAITPATRLVLLCSPNNPTGTALRRDDVSRFLDEVPPDVLVVLDEAYHEFVADPDVVDGVELARGRANLAVLRTFSKAYGLAGLRVGYCVAPPPVAEAVRKVFLPFSVNSLAQAAAIASLDAKDELLARCRGVVEERERVRGELLALGYEVAETQANFVWLPLGERTPAFNEHCLDHKVVIRPFATDGVRVTVGMPEENDAFLAAARSFTSTAAG